jgi:hypothetical protein
MGTSSVGFHPPNPPQMTKEEKYVAAARRFEEPPLRECRDRAVINPRNTLEFVSQ